MRRARPRAVVALAVVRHRKLPVAVLDDRGAVGDLEFLQVGGRHVVVGRGLEEGDGGWLVSEANEHHAGRDPGKHGPQSVLARVEVRPHVMYPEKLAIEVVGLLAVGAEQPSQPPAEARTDAAAAVPADVVEGRHGPVRTAHDHDRIVAHLERRVAPRFGQLGRGGCEDPTARPDVAQVSFVQLGCAVEGARKRPVGAAGPKQGQKGRR